MVYQAEHRVRMAAGISARGVPVRAENGNVARWYGAATVIHSYKIAKEKRKDHTARLECSNRDLQELLENIFRNLRIRYLHSNGQGE